MFQCFCGITGNFFPVLPHEQNTYIKGSFDYLDFSLGIFSRKASFFSEGWGSILSFFNAHFLVLFLSVGDPWVASAVIGGKTWIWWWSYACFRSSLDRAAVLDKNDRKKEAVFSSESKLYTWSLEFDHFFIFRL